MDGLSVGDRLEMDLARFRAEMDQKFARVDERFVAVERFMLESERRTHAAIAHEASSVRRFVLTTSVSVASLVLAVMIPMFVAVLLGN